MPARFLLSLAAALVIGALAAAPVSADSDVDGVADDSDQCAASDLSATVVIETCDSGVANDLFATGCSIADLIAPCADAPKNHGKYVSCVSRTLNVLKKSGAITGREKAAIQRCAAKSSIGKP
jgi:hypothetical protein